MHLLTRIAGFAGSAEPLVDLSAIDKTALGTDGFAQAFVRDATSISRRYG